MSRAAPKRPGWLDGTLVSNIQFTDFNLDPALAEAVAAAADDEIIEGVVRLEDPELIPPGFERVSQFVRICTGRFRAADTWNIRRHPNVVSLKAARPLGISHEGRSAGGEGGGRSFERPLPFTGRGSIVAMLDFGLDFAHPNFLNPDGSTRVRGLWHQGAPYDRARTNPYGYGRVFSRQEINTALRRSNPYEALGYRPWISDIGRGSHGTHTTDIAAGNGRAPNSLPGVAPDAELLFVHLSTPRSAPGANLGDSVRMLEALDFVHRSAGAQPCAINLSVGRTAGSHDGTSPFEHGMHELLGLASGRAIAQSAGNYRSAHLATHGLLREGEEREIKWNINPLDTKPTEIDAWYSGNDRFRVRVLAPTGRRWVEAGLGQVVDLKSDDGELIGRFYHRKNDPNNNDNHIDVFLYPNAPAGPWRLRLLGEYVINGRFHAWIERETSGAGNQARFEPGIASSSYTLGTIATSPMVLTVGAVDSHSEGGTLAPFSSCGPTRDERRDKPELLAPGVKILAARSIPRGAAQQEGLLIELSGTSMAAPHVTGTVAVMFEAAGRPLATEEIRDCLKRSAEPAMEGINPYCCGWGRLNIASAITTARELREPKPLNSFTAIESVDFDAADFFDRAELAVRRSYGRTRASETAFLEWLLREVGNPTVAGFSPAALYRAASNERSWVNEGGRALEVIAVASQPHAGRFRAGDWMIRKIPGTGDIGHVSVLASGDLGGPCALAAAGIASESSQPGHYAIVVEAGAFPHTRSRPFARRLLDRQRRVPPCTLFLRPRYSRVGGADAATDEPTTHLEFAEPYLDFDAADADSVAPRGTHIRRSGMPAEEIESLQGDPNAVEDDGSGATSATLPSPWPQHLDAHLTEVTAPHPLRAALDVVAQTSRFKKIAFAVADLSSRPRPYAGSRDAEQRFIASTGKLAILFAAFQLRKAMREAAALVTDSHITSDTQLFAAIMRSWRAKIGRYFHGAADGKDSLPALGAIFATASRPAGGWAVEFNNATGRDGRRGFFDRLQGAVMNSDDDDAGSCIRDLGFPYIHGCAAEAGIWKAGKGLWVALDYAGTRWWPTTLQDAGSPQAATARSLVEFLTLLEFDELVPGSRSEMLDLLSGARQGKSVGVISYVNVGVQSHLSAEVLKTLDVRAKVGYTGPGTHGDAAIVKHSGTAGGLHYSVALLGGLDADTTEAAARALDIALGAISAPAAHESAESDEDQEALSRRVAPATISGRIRRTGAPAEDFEPYEDFAFEPTAGQSDFGPKLRKLWHEKIDKLFGRVIKTSAETIAAGLGLPVTNPPAPAVAAQLRFFNPVSVSPTITPAEANVTWVAFPHGKGIASPDIYTQFDGDPVATALRNQDEYCEWRVIKNAAGQIQRVIFTSEPPEYYRFLHDPFGEDGEPVLDPAVRSYARKLLVKLYQERCGSTGIVLGDLEDLAGAYDPGNKYNNEYCVHLQFPANNLFAEIDIAASTAIVRSKGGKLITNVQELNDCVGFGVMKRRSDPLIGDTVNGAARENRLLTLENPVGLYMTSLDTRGWTTPDGTDPQSFFRVLKGRVDKDPGRSMIVRAQFAVPASKKYTVSNIKIGGVPITFGGQIAENLHMRLGVRVGPKNTDLTGGKLAAITPVPCP